LAFGASGCISRDTRWMAVRSRTAILAVILVEIAVPPT
jgi:hypothetical protein